MLKKLLIRRLIWLLLSFCSSLHSLQAQDSLLNPGDIAIIGFQADNNDQFCFVATVAIAPGIKILFSEKGWDGSLPIPAFANNSEAVHTWTSPPNGIDRGSFMVVNFGSTGGSPHVNLGSILSSGNAGFAAAGDQLIAFQGSASNPHFIYALSTNRWILTGSPTTNKSWLPSSLINGISARDFPSEMDDQYFHIPISIGPRDSILTSIGRTQNWTRSNTRFLLLPEWAFFIYRFYYSKPMGSITDLNSWGMELNGSGTAPMSFTDSGYTYFLSNRIGIQYLENQWNITRLCIDSGIILALNGHAFSIQDLAQEGIGKIRSNEQDQITITGQSGPLNFEADTASLKKIVLATGAVVSIGTHVQIVGGPNPGLVLLQSLAVLTTNGKLTLCENVQGKATILQIGTGSQLIGTVMIKQH